MSTPTVSRWPNGVSDSTQDGPLANFAGLSPYRYHTWFSDFDNWTAADWVVTETQAGATEVITSEDGGILLITNTTADNDLVSAQLSGDGGTTTAETFKWASTKDMVIAAKFKLNEVIQSDMLIGLAITDTSPLETLPSDGLFFYKADASAALVAQLRKNGTATSLALGSMVADTYIEVAIVYNATDVPGLAGGTWRAFVNGSLVVSTTTLTNVVDDEELAVTIALQQGEATNAKIMSVDYLLVAKQR